MTTEADFLKGKVSKPPSIEETTQPTAHWCPDEVWPEGRDAMEAKPTGRTRHSRPSSSASGLCHMPLSCHVSWPDPFPAPEKTEPGNSRGVQSCQI